MTEPCIRCGGGLSFVEAVERLAGDRGLSGEADP
jgi:hypothetical protein